MRSNWSFFAFKSLFEFQKFDVSPRGSLWFCPPWSSLGFLNVYDHVLKFGKYSAIIYSNFFLPVLWLLQCLYSYFYIILQIHHALSIFLHFFSICSSYWIITIVSPSSSSIIHFACSDLLLNPTGSSLFQFLFFPAVLLDWFL